MGEVRRQEAAGGANRLKKQEEVGAGRQTRCGGRSDQREDAGRRPRPFSPGFVSSLMLRFDWLLLARGEETLRAPVHLLETV